MYPAVARRRCPCVRGAKGDDCRGIGDGAIHPPSTVRARELVALGVRVCHPIRKHVSRADDASRPISPTHHPTSDDGHSALPLQVVGVRKRLT